MLPAGAVEGRLVLHDDRRGEGVEADHREGAVLREQVQPDQQRAARHREAQLRQHDAAEHPPGAEPEAARRLLEGGVEPAQRGRDRAGRRTGSRTARRSARPTEQAVRATARRRPSRSC